MRQKRAKTYKKLMALYSLSFGFRQPYQVLVDSEMCKTSVDQKLDLVKQLTSVLQGPVKPMITQCCIHELYLQHKTLQPAIDLAKTFERRRCNHREAIPGDDCVMSVIGETNKHRYVVATQSHPLRVKLRQIPAVPIVHINRAVMVLEPPSDATKAAKDTAEQQRLRPSAPDLALVKPGGTEEPPRKKRKGPKGPNPLSVKKKADKPTNQPKKAGADKGKGRAVEPSRDSDALQSTTTSAGEKRKRGEDEDGVMDDAGPSAADDTTRTSRKRKRRRKTKGGQEVES
ncbi:hypothetical protein HGRIS_007720 [Hohenbuehelia grisea]|uniref:UTP23 sensor motif region domain-containing protein n=1 Tax=Hohenbuehelia grisea TaxID=104357 RepID=A0ABR3J645_9AGAR